MPFQRLITVLLRLVIAGLLVAGPPSVSAETVPKPNIVFILADDLGYGDLECYGHPRAKTPVINQLAKDGVRFTQHYSNGTECSPTRTAFLTGRYQQRVKGLECAIGTGNVGRYDDAIEAAKANNLGLPASSTVIPGQLKRQGYTCAVYGKWHLGYESRFNPMVHGWDRFFGYLGGNVHYFNHRETSDLHVLYSGDQPADRDGYMTDLITNDSVAFIREQAGADKPFFLYVSHECPHFPFQGPKDKEKIVTKENWMEADDETYVAMLQDLDTQVGRILTALDDCGITDNTVVVFASDNGGFAAAAHMGGLRGAKSTTYEGGIRVPLIIRWPGKIKSGIESHQPCMTFDLTRSFLEIAGVKLQGLRLDGDGIIQHIVKENNDYRRTLFWRGKRGDRTWTAVRDGDAKLVRKEEGSQTEEWLFDLKNDPTEQGGLDSDRDRIRLQAKLKAWETEMDGE